MTRPPLRSPAFTLLEVLCALVVLGLVSAAVIPLIRDGSRWRSQDDDLVRILAAVDLLCHDPTFRWQATRQPLPGDTPWEYRIEAIPPQMPVGLVGEAGVPRSWWRLTVTARGDERILHELVVARPSGVP